MNLISPGQRYEQAVSAGELKHDAVQWSAIQALDEVFLELQKPPQDKKWYMPWQPQERPNVPGVYLFGGVGTGKTMLMDLFYESLSKGMARRVHFHRFMQSVHEHKERIKNQQSPLKLIAQDIAEKHRVLCLDEFAVTDITDAMLLYGLLDALFENGITLVTTSNTRPDNLYKNGLQRARFLPAIELINQHTRLVEVDGGQDYRMAFLQNTTIYLSPLNTDTESSIRQSFITLSGQSETSKSEIELSGRTVSVLGTGSGTVWFDCDVLCESPRSKVDYIELSKRFHTLFLSGVRVFDQYREDNARRFIELIDEMYDRGVNVIISAEVLPDQLYQGKKLSDVFQRTISRLQEMQSDDYLARPHLA